jgi:hypothetical protein
MISTRRAAVSALIALTAVAGLAACGDDDDSGSSSSTAPPETEAPGTEAPEGTEAPDDTDSPGDTAAGEPTVDAATDVLVGLSEDDAEEAADEQGWTIRVVVRDGEDLPATMDFRPERVNVEVTDGEVTAVVSVG